MAVKLVQIPYQRLPELKAKAKFQKSFRLKPLTPRFLRRSAGQFALVADRSPLNSFLRVVSDRPLLSKRSRERNLKCNLYG